MASSTSWDTKSRERKWCQPSKVSLADVPGEAPLSCLVVTSESSVPTGDVVQTTEPLGELGSLGVPKKD